MRCLGLLLVWGLLATTSLGCRRDPAGADAPTTDQPALHTPGAERSQRAESAGLVGPGAVDVEAIEVVDTGPRSPVVVFTAGLKGYTEPCGCSLDLVLGGIDRVAGFSRAAAGLGTSSLVLDAGDLWFEHDEIEGVALAQELRKATVLAEAHRQLGTAATVPGTRDLANGLAWYQQTVAQTEMRILAANLTAADGSPLGESHYVTALDGIQLGVVGAVDATVYAHRTDVVATDAAPAVQTAVDAARAAGANTVLLIFQGDIVAARQQLGEITGLDFIVIGRNPRQTDESERVGSAVTLEAYDQGRYVGRLKLHAPADAPATTPWQSARAGSQDEMERLRRVLEGLEERLAQIPPNADGTDSPLRAAQRERIETYREELATMERADLHFADGARTYLWQPTAMSPGYPTLEPVTTAMIAYNQDLQAINLANVEAIPPVPEGQAGYVGAATCATCHPAANTFWETTSHAHAIDTLIERDKQFDRSCIGCHVTGYREPGGSVLGNLRDLENVQCEQCHGPGSLHVANPTLRNVDGGVWTAVPESTCVSCHNHEHSVHFAYDAYRARILGPGHGAPP